MKHIVLSVLLIVCLQGAAAAEPASGAACTGVSGRSVLNGADGG